MQVVEYKDGQTIVHKHIASTHHLSELPDLFQAGHQWIEQTTGQRNLFSSNTNPDKHTQHPTVLLTKHLQAVCSQPLLIYQVFSFLSDRLGLNSLSRTHPSLGRLLLDLALMRLVNPGSKLEAIESLQDLFGITYRRSDVYRKLVSLGSLKPDVEETLVAFAKRHLRFNFTMVFYDVTTLYFESFQDDDDLKRRGFSKDNKFNQPQLVIGLVVNETGFPITHHIFPGNTFEGHTILPIILDLKQKHRIQTLTVVADAAMISDENVAKLTGSKLDYIVGARIGNLRQTLIAEISRSLNQEDGKTMRLSTVKGELICSFSETRFAKDRHDTEKQLERAAYYLKHPTKAVKRLKFLSIISKRPTLNQKLLAKTKLLWGIKGYYTNTQLSDQEVITQYQNLWHVEQSFRLTKSDLKARPIFMQRTKTIQAHILICFVALAVAKVIELKTQLSLKKVVKTLGKVQDITLLDTLTGKTVILRSQLNANVENILKNLGFPY